MERARFRAWNSVTKEMSPCFYIDEWIHQKPGFVVIKEDSPFTKEDIIFMQSTGLLDRWGVEIFQSDLIQYIDKDLWQGYWEVVFQDGGRAWDLIPHPRTRDYDRNNIGSMIGTGRFQVMGNVYANPDLTYTS